MDRGPQSFASRLTDPALFGTGNDYFPHIDAVLGPRESRYFGSGFQRVRYDATVVTTDRGPLLADGTLCVRYPANWSVKTAPRALRPHLSTIDAVYLGAALSEWALHYAFAAPAHHPTPLITRCEIRSGTAPDEDLEALPFALHTIGTAPNKDRSSPYGLNTALQLHIGAMQLEVELAHNGAFAYGHAARQPNPLMSASPQAHACRLATAGAYQIDLQQVVLDHAGQCASAEAWFAPSAPGYRLLSYVEFALASAQLAQTIIYRTDCVERAHSNTLWMRDFKIAAAAHCKVCEPQLIELRTLNHKRQTIGGEVWSVFRFLCRLGPLGATFTFAHKLSSEQAAAQPAEPA
jgi:hypothetical protein